MHGSDGHQENHIYQSAGKMPVHSYQSKLDIIRHLAQINEKRSIAFDMLSGDKVMSYALEVYPHKVIGYLEPSESNHKEQPKLHSFEAAIDPTTAKKLTDMLKSEKNTN
jgi:hypothetical protein